MGNKPRGVPCEKLIESFQNSNLQSVLAGSHDLFQTVHQDMVSPPRVSPHHSPLDSFPRPPEASNLLELLVQSGNQNSISSSNKSDVLGSLGGGGGGVIGGKGSHVDISQKIWTSPTKLAPSSIWMLQHHIDKPSLPILPGLAGSGTSSPKTAGCVVTSNVASAVATAAAPEERGGVVCQTRPRQQTPSLWCDRNGGGKHAGDVVVKAGMSSNNAHAMLVKPDRSHSSEVFAIGADSSSPRGMSKELADMDAKMLDSSDCSDHNMDEQEEKNVSNQLGMCRPVSKNLVSERKRRKKLNEGLYTLRALVPRISKMDKASIIGDAIDYVRELQKQVEELQAGISDMEANTAGEEVLSSVAETSGVQISDASCWEEDGSRNSEDKGNTEDNLVDLMAESSEQKILELDVSLMEDQIYHLRIFCTKGPGVFVQLMQSLEAIGLEVLNANLTSLQDSILNTFIAEIKDWEMMKTEDVKKAIMDVASRFGLQ